MGPSAPKVPPLMGLAMGGFAAFVVFVFFAWEEQYRIAVIAALAILAFSGLMALVLKHDMESDRRRTDFGDYGTPAARSKTNLTLQGRTRLIVPALCIVVGLVFFVPTLYFGYFGEGFVLGIILILFGGGMAWGLNRRRP